MGTICSKLFQFTSLRLPKSQNTMEGSSSNGSAIYFIIPSPAENNADTAIPERTKDSCSDLPILLEIRMVRKRAINPKIKANVCIRKLEFLKTIIAKDAPNPAAWFTPSNPGSAKGFLKTLWRINPVTEMPIPTNIPKSIRGPRTREIRLSNRLLFTIGIF